MLIMIHGQKRLTKIRTMPNSCQLSDARWNILSYNRLAASKRRKRVSIAMFTLESADGLDVLYNVPIIMECCLKREVTFQLLVVNDCKARHVMETHGTASFRCLSKQLRKPRIYNATSLKDLARARKRKREKNCDSL